MSEHFWSHFCYRKKWKTIINSKRWKILISARVQAQQKRNFLPCKYAANVLITRLRSPWPGSKDERCITFANRGLLSSPSHVCYKKMMGMVLRVVKAA